MVYALTNEAVNECNINLDKSSMILHCVGSFYCIILKYSIGSLKTL